MSRGFSFDMPPFPLKGGSYHNMNKFFSKNGMSPPLGGLGGKKRKKRLGWGAKEKETIGLGGKKRKKRLGWGAKRKRNDWVVGQ